MKKIVIRIIYQAKISLNVSQNNNNNNISSGSNRYMGCPGGNNNTPPQTVILNTQCILRPLYSRVYVYHIILFFIYYYYHYYYCSFVYTHINTLCKVHYANVIIRERFVLFYIFSSTHIIGRAYYKDQTNRFYYCYYIIRIYDTYTRRAPDFVFFFSF